MASPNEVRVQFDTLRSLAFGSISGTYAAIGTAFTRPARMIKISNQTNADMFISFDGTNNHDLVASNGFVLYDYNSNMSAQGGYFMQKAGTVVYVKQVSAPTSGSVYVTVIYAE
jgi:hypothetical protein